MCITYISLFSSLFSPVFSWNRIIQVQSNDKVWQAEIHRQVNWTKKYVQEYK